MCGILGYYSFKSNKIPDKEKISNMFSLLESRGRDACGTAFVKQDGNLFVHKAAIKSSEMINTEEWKNLSLPPIMIMHTRMKTQGDQKNNMNNHPLFSKNGIALVHNGIILNEKQIFANKKRDAEVDSEAILALLGNKKGDRIKRLFDQIEGCFAVAVLDREEPNKLILIKKDNPIDLYYDSENDIMYFCSERDIMRDALNLKGNSQRGFNLGEGNYHFYEMQNNHCLIINKEGVESYKKYHPKPRAFHRDWFGSASLKYMNSIECPWCLTQTSYDFSSLKNQCDYCGMEISQEDLEDVL